eukprot:363211-Chlamydomonas_euryale.AAC.9
MSVPRPHADHKGMETCGQLWWCCPLIQLSCAWAETFRLLHAPLARKVSRGSDAVVVTSCILPLLNQERETDVANIPSL